MPHKFNIIKTWDRITSKNQKREAWHVKSSVTEYAISLLGKIQKKNVSEWNGTLKEKHTRLSKDYSNLGNKSFKEKHLKRPKDDANLGRTIRTRTRS